MANLETTYMKPQKSAVPYYSSLSIAFITTYYSCFFSFRLMRLTLFYFSIQSISLNHMLVYHPAPCKSYPNFYVYLSIVLVLAETTFHGVVSQVPVFEV